MPELWTGITGIVILILFWRQLTLFKMQKKIRYAPLVLLIGLISSILLFLFSSTDLRSDIEHALMPLLVALIFYLLMYLVYELKRTFIEQKREDEQKLLEKLLFDIKEYFNVIDTKLSDIESTDEKTLEVIQMAVKSELSEFIQLSNQQKTVSQKLEQIYLQEESSLIKIEKFLEKDLANFDTVIHRHIDMLRISQQEHFNKTYALLSKIEQSESSQIATVIDDFILKLQQMQNLFKEGAEIVVNESSSKIKSVVEHMSSDIQNTKQLSESLLISMQEYEVKLQELHKQATLLLEKSDTIHESMEDTFLESQKIRPVYASLDELISRLMNIYADYKSVKKELSIVTSELGEAEGRHFEIMDKKIDALSEEIRTKVEDSIQELKEHYHIASSDVTNTVKTLAAKAQMKKSYTNDEIGGSN